MEVVMNHGHRKIARLSVGRCVGLAAAAALILATIAAPARADGWDHHDHHWDRGGDWHHHDYRGWRHRDWGYYHRPYYAVPGPPVIYGRGYYYAPAPPPVVYGPGVGIGINTPGFSVGIGIP
jgi:hypothetical protein